MSHFWSEKFYKEILRDSLDRGAQTTQGEVVDFISRGGNLENGAR